MKAVIILAAMVAGAASYCAPETWKRLRTQSIECGQMDIKDLLQSLHKGEVGEWNRMDLHQTPSWIKCFRE
jgi:hypothetical protein